MKVRGEAVLIGSCPELTRHYVEIRGLGLVNVTDLFGVAATRSSKRIELVVQLERWELGREYDRLGLTTDTQEVLGVSIPLIRMPVAPGRNVAMLEGPRAIAASLWGAVTRRSCWRTLLTGSRAP